MIGLIPAFRDVAADLLRTINERLDRASSVKEREVRMYVKVSKSHLKPQMNANRTTSLRFPLPSVSSVFPSILHPVEQPGAASVIVGKLKDPAGVGLHAEEGPLPFPIPPCA